MESRLLLLWFLCISTLLILICSPPVSCRSVKKRRSPSKVFTGRLLLPTSEELASEEVRNKRELINEFGDTVEEEDAERELEEYDEEHGGEPKKRESNSTTTTTTTTTTGKPSSTASTTKAPPPTSDAPPSNSSQKPGPPPGSQKPGPPPGVPPPRPGGPPPNFKPGGRPPPGLPPGFPGGLPPGLPPGLFGPPAKPTPPPPPAKAGELYLPDHYNKLEIPKLDVGKPLGIKIETPVPVFLYLNIRSIRELDEEKEELTLEMDMVVEWVDGILFDKVTLVPDTIGLPGKKLKPPPPQKTLSPIFLNKIWSPDIYIDNLIDVTSPKLINRPQRLKFNSGNGFISFYKRVSAKVKCDMDFYYYPADTQRCPVVLKSYSYFNSDLNLMWSKHGVFLQEINDANFDLAAGNIEAFKIMQDFDNYKNESHDALKFTISARRKLSYHLVQTYIPSVFFVVITWLCFMIPPRMVDARIAMAMTTLLTMVAMFASVRDGTPVVSYVKAIDIWMVACIFFIFLTLLEFAVLVWFQSAREDSEAAALEQERELADKLSDLEKRAMKRTRKERQRPTSEIVGTYIEKYAFIIYSIVFIIFAVLYWTWLLSAAEYISGWSVNATHNKIEND